MRIVPISPPRSGPPPIRRSCRPHSVTNPALQPAPLPLELIDLVIKWLWWSAEEHTQATLAACCLTSRAFLPSARRALYTSIGLTITKTEACRPSVTYGSLELERSDMAKVEPATLVRTLESSPHLARLVGCIHLECLKKEPWATSYEIHYLLGRLFRCCPSISRLAITWGRIPSLGDFQAVLDVLREFVSSHPLKVLWIPFPINLDPETRRLVLDIVCAFPLAALIALKVHVFEDSDFNPSEFSPPKELMVTALTDISPSTTSFLSHPSIQRSLRSLNLIAVDVLLSDYNLECLYNLESLEVCLMYTEPHDKTAVARDTRAALSTLRIKSLDFRSELPASYLYDTESGDLDFLPPALQYLHIPFPPIATLTTFLESSLCPDLSFIGLKTTDNAPNSNTYQYSPFSISGLQKAAASRGMEIDMGEVARHESWPHDKVKFFDD